MQPTTFETTIVNGQIPLPAGINLPEHARLVVTIAEPAQGSPPRIASPRLADPAQGGDFVMEVVDSTDASV